MSAVPLCVSCQRSPGVVRPTPLRSAVCGPCWAAVGGQASAEEIDAPPAETVPVRDPAGQGEWLRRLEADDLVVRRNRPTRRRLLALARELAHRADWDTFETWPTWDRLMATTGWARSTMAAWLRELRLRGWLATLEHGSTPQFRPMALRDAVQGNRAAVYALRIPLTADEQAAGDRVGSKTWTPTSSFDHDQKSSGGGSSRARPVVHNWTAFRAAERTIEALRARFDEKQALDFAVRAPVGRAQMLAAAAQLRPQHPILARLSVKALRAVCRPYWAAGWTNTDVLHALRYRPTSWSKLPSIAEYVVIHPAGWASSRLAAWRTPRGRILPGFTDHQAVRAQVRARHGRAAEAVLPKGARLLTPTDVREYARRQRAAAMETVARNQRRDRVDALSRPRPAHEAAAASARRAAVEAWRAEDAQRRTLRAELLARARAAKPTPRPEPVVLDLGLPSARTPEERHERAKARAAAERRARQRLSASGTRPAADEASSPARKSH
ncbi:hypothetical protein [Amycolatopsis sacchari]|uniref:hypothetical protein n=1 Tax=Amycolatopsis sacchari TaxID=115433 RepID=UPI003D71E159